MAEKIVIELDVNTLKGKKQIDDLSKSFNKLESSLVDVKESSDKTKESIDEVASNGGAIAILDQLTGGLATQFKNVYESTRLFNVSLKGTKTALLATGIGAFVVILGTIVAYWDEISNFIDGTTRKLETQQGNLTKQLETQTVQLDLLKQQLAIEELKNGESPKLTAEYRKQLVIQREQNIALLENLQTQLQLEESKNKEVTFWEKTKILASGLVGLSLQAEQIGKAASKTSEKSIELTNKINEAKKKTGAIDLELAQLDDKQTKKKEEAAEKAKAKRDKELEDEFNHQEKINAIREKFRLQNEDAEDITEFEKLNRRYERDLLELERLDATQQQKLDLEAYYNSLRQTQFLENEDYFDQLEMDAEDKRLERKQKDLENEKQLEQQKLAVKLKALNDLQMIFGAESAMGRAALIAKQLLAAKELLIDLGVIKSKASKAIVTSNLEAASSGSAVSSGLAQTLKLGFPAAIPALIGYAATAAGIISTVLAATKKTKSVASSIGGTGGGDVSIGSVGASVSQPPAFNVVGASSTNQLADAIGSQSQEPVKAYVVSNDVTTAQSMDRNIVNGASI